EARPIHVCLESRTRGHLLVVMLAYLLVQELATCWRDFDHSVEEGLAELKCLCTTHVTVKGRSVGEGTRCAARSATLRKTPQVFLSRSLAWKVPRWLDRRTPSVVTGRSNPTGQSPVGK
ncbi:MAG: hypothetical protein ACQESR_24395, partial [Planctomycetota bacterium]